jgi:DNA-binding PadR family transcriptional regulator
MFESTTPHDTHGPRGHRNAGRNHHRDPRRDIGRDARRGGSAGQGGPGNPGFSLRGFFGQGRPGALIRRGEIRPLILDVLQRKPMHGYEVIQELESMSGGRWRPSAGSVYPTLQQLSDEGLVTSEEVEGRRTYTLTDAGKAAVAASPHRSPWTADDGDREPDIRQLVMQLLGAVMQVQKMGSPAARRESRQILADARRQVYRLLADDEEAAPDESKTPAE